MQIYRLRPGIVLTSICGEYILVAAKSARAFCPYASRIDESGAFVWRCLETGMDEKQIVEAVLKEYEVDDPAEVLSLIRDFLKQIGNRGYLLSDEKGEQHEE